MAVITSRHFSTSARSVTGLIRPGNEDSALHHSHLLAIADGMGGHAGGEIASAIAINILAQIIPVIDSGSIDSDSVEDLLMNSLYDVNAEIRRVADNDEELLGMGTTLSALHLYSSDKRSFVALIHVGDTRAYRLRDGVLTQLSHDHTVIQELLDQGVLKVGETSDHPQRSMLTQVLMGDNSIAPVLMIYEVEEKDRFLLSSDGLHGIVSEAELLEGVQIADKDEAVTFLIDTAYKNGAPDNVTVLVADITVGVSEGSSIFLGAAQVGHNG